MLSKRSRPQNKAYSDFQYLNQRLSLKVNYDTESGEITNVGYRSGIVTDIAAYNADATYGIMYIPAASFTGNNLKQVAEGAHTLEELQENGKKYGNVQAMEMEAAFVAKPDDTEGVPLEQAKYMQYALVLNGMYPTHLDTTLITACFAIYDGSIFVANQAVGNCKDVAKQMIESGKYDEDNVKVLEKIVNYGQQ